MSTRDDVALTPGAATRRTRVRFIAALGSLLLAPGRTLAGPDEPVVRAAKSIHEEVEFKAERRRVYAALTQARPFDHVSLLSDAMRQGGVAPGTAPTEISAQAGGTFSLFGGYIVGRQIELVPDERIVQAWRVASWQPGIFSIARFELEARGSATRLVFDHTGFPSGQAEHLAHGWKVNYWEPLEKYLA